MVSVNSSSSMRPSALWPYAHAPSWSSRSTDVSPGERGVRQSEVSVAEVFIRNHRRVHGLDAVAMNSVEGFRSQ